MIFLYTAAVLALLYLIFIFAPALVIYFNVFSRKAEGAPLKERDLIGTRYEPYRFQLLSAESFVKSRPYEHVRVTARDGVTLCGMYFDNGSDTTVIFVHGYRGAPISNFCLQAQRLYTDGYNLLFIVSRAHGESGGKRLGLGTLEQYDLLPWIDFAAAKNGVNNLFVYGSSMGAASVGFASDKIQNPKVKGLVLDCGFSSPREQLIRDSKIRHLPYPFLLPLLRLFGRIDMKTDIYATVGDSLSRTAIPVLFFHGAQDITVPVEQGLKNYRACASEKEFVQVEGADHIIAYVVGGEQTRQKLDAFIRERSE